MATDKEFIVNKKFFLGFITIQVILLAIFAYVILSPKTVTVRVEKLEHAFSTKEVLEIIPPSL